MRDCKLETLIVPLPAEDVLWQAGGVPEPPRYTSRYVRHRRGPNRWPAWASRAPHQGQPDTIERASELRSCDENPEALAHDRYVDSQWGPAGRWNRTSWQTCDGLHRQALVCRVRRPGRLPSQDAESVYRAVLHSA